MKTMRKLVGPIIWVIVVAFCLWGVQSAVLSLRKETQGVGKAFGQIVTFKEFRDAIRSAEIFSDRPEAEKPTVEQLEQSAWQHIVLSREATREKINVTDDEVRSEIERLIGDIAKNRQAYTVWTSRTFGEDPRAFEERVRNMIRIQKLMKQHPPENTLPAPHSDEDVRRFYVNDQSKLWIEFAKLPATEEASQFKSQMTDVKSWESEKTKENSRINSLGPLTPEIMTAVFQLTQDNLDKLASLAPDQLSEPIQTKDGFGIFRITNKEMADAGKMDAALLEEYRKRLGDEKKQQVFFAWWNDVFARAKIEKFSQDSSQ